MDKGYKKRFIVDIGVEKIWSWGVVGGGDFFRAVESDVGKWWEEGIFECLVDAVIRLLGGHMGIYLYIID